MRNIALFVSLMVSIPALAEDPKPAVAKPANGQVVEASAKTDTRTVFDAGHHLVAEGEVPDVDNLNYTSGRATAPQPGMEKAVGTIGNAGDCSRFINQQMTKGKMQVAVNAIAECRRIGVDQYTVETERLVALKALEVDSQAVITNQEGSIAVNNDAWYNGGGVIGAMFSGGPTASNFYANMGGLTPSGPGAVAGSNPASNDEAERKALLDEVRH